MFFGKHSESMGHKKNILMFIAVNVLLSVIPLTVMFAQNRIPSTHDTFSYLLSQFNIFNEAATKGAMPFWMPFTAHGQNAALTTSFQLSPFAPVIWLLGFAGVKINFLWFYFLGIWFDEFMFQVGIFLLATIYYRRIETAVFVAISLVGGIVWSCQIWNFHQIYFIPMALYALHKTISSKEIKWIFLLALFLSFGVNSVATYNIIFTLFVFAIYLLSIFPLHRPDFKYFLNIKSSMVFILKSAIVAALFAFSIISLIKGMNALDVGGRGRDASGTVSLDTFMTYGGSIGFEKYFDFIFRAPQSHDVSLYAGALLIPLSIVAVVYHRRGYTVSLLVTSLAILLFCAGTPVTIGAYYLFPGFKYFRHIGLVAPVLKVFLVCLSGYGFETLIEDKSKIKSCGFIVAVYCLTVLAFFWMLDRHIIPLGLPPVYSFEKLPFLFTAAALLIVSIAAANVKRIAGAYPVLVVLIILLDLLAYRFQYQVGTVPVASKSFVDMFEPVDYGFQMSREDIQNSRFRQFLGTPHRWKNLDLALYDSSDWFLFSDFLTSPFLVLTKEKPVAELTDFSDGFQKEYTRFGALSQPKLKVYRDIRYIGDPSVIRELLLAPNAGGDSLYSENKLIKSAADAVNDSLLNKSLIDRVNADFKIKKFAANTLALTVEILPDLRQGDSYYLLYADAYNPFWKARVNGQDTPVIKADIAYKAVKIPSGISAVEFFIYDPLMVASVIVSQGLAFVAFIVTWYLWVRWCKESL